MKTHISSKQKKKKTQRRCSSHAGSPASHSFALLICRPLRLALYPLSIFAPAKEMKALLASSYCLALRVSYASPGPCLTRSINTSDSERADGHTRQLHRHSIILQGHGTWAGLDRSQQTEHNIRDRFKLGGLIIRSSRLLCISSFAVQPRPHRHWDAVFQKLAEVAEIC